MQRRMDENHLNIAEVVELLHSLASSTSPFTFDVEKQRLFFTDDDDVPCELTLPRVLPTIDGRNMEEIREQIEKSHQTYTIILIQAGAAAMGYYEDRLLRQHKVVKKYMVRKKQGKSQIKYLKSKGKSRLGSRIRLQNTVLFFEEINATLGAWDVSEKSEAILLSVPINLKNLLFSSKIPPPFDKKDPRIKRIPMDVRVPTFKELKHVDWMVTRGTLRRGRDRDGGR